VGFLSNNGQRNAAEIEREIRANLLPGVVTVPAMVIAIEKAQGKGIAYNRQ
jgi:intracellular sulfur oxidation DsrE/DsrF family protein